MLADRQEMEKLPEILQFLPPTKTREQDPVLRMMCVEILLLLSTSEYCALAERPSLRPSPR